MSDMLAKLTHNHQDGTLLDIFDLRPHPETKAVVKAAGFRWSRNIGWHLPHTRDSDLSDVQLARIVEAFASVGIETETHIENTNRQAVLASHGSAPAHTQHIARIRSQIEQSADAATNARTTKQQAAATRRNAERAGDPNFLINRILEAERNKDHDTATNITALLAKSGVRFIDPSTIEPGQRWNVRNSWVQVVRVNTKTVTVYAIHPNGQPVFNDTITNRIDLRYFHEAVPPRK